MIYRFALAQVECKRYVLLKNCKQNETSLSLLAGRTVDHQHSYYPPPKAEEYRFVAVCLSFRPQPELGKQRLELYKTYTEYI